jgi:hypothetical protein
VRALVAVNEYRSKDRSLSSSERDLANCDVSIAETGRTILEVEYIPHEEGEKSYNRSGDTSLGRAVVYGVRTKDFQVEWARRFK